MPRQSEQAQLLGQKSALVIGVGGLGCPALLALARSGIGRVVLADDDEVSLSNLQRQIIHTTTGAGTRKVDSAGAFVAALNPNVVYEATHTRVETDNARLLVGVYDIVLDGTDNFPTRKVIAEAAERNRKPLVSGAVSMFDGQVTTFVKGGPRFVDLYPKDPDPEDLPSCEMVGVLGAVTGVIGTLMAMEAIKLITGLGEPLVGRLLLYDGRAARFTELTYERGAD